MNCKNKTKNKKIKIKQKGKNKEKQFSLTFSDSTATNRGTSRPTRTNAAPQARKLVLKLTHTHIHMHSYTGVAFGTRSYEAAFVLLLPPLCHSCPLVWHSAALQLNFGTTQVSPQWHTRRRDCDCECNIWQTREKTTAKTTSERGGMCVCVYLCMHVCRWLSVNVCEWCGRTGRMSDWQRDIAVIHCFRSLYICCCRLQLCAVQVKEG